MKDLFFCSEAGEDIVGTNPGGNYAYHFWKPSPLSVVPKGMPLIPFAVWWVFHYLRLFSNQGYTIFVIYDGKRLIHRSCVFPGYFRFPFMGKDDLQIGDTWTAPDHRGKGLALFALQEISRLQKRPGRKFWYVVDESNIPSIRVVEKAGFTKVGEGTRTKRFGLSLLGAYVIQRQF